MDDHKKKKVAPILITVLMLIYFVVYFGILITIVPFFALKIILGIVPLLLGVGMIVVCVQRLKEIDGAEEDDLDQY